MVETRGVAAREACGVKAVRKILTRVSAQFCHEAPW